MNKVLDAVLAPTWYRSTSCGTCHLFHMLTVHVGIGTRALSAASHTRHVHNPE